MQDPIENRQEQCSVHCRRVRAEIIVHNTAVSYLVFTSSYLSRGAPSKLDRDVLWALCGVDVDVREFPHVYQWKRLIESFKEQERKQYVSLIKIIIQVVLCEFCSLTAFMNFLCSHLICIPHTVQKFKFVTLL